MSRFAYEVKLDKPNSTQQRKCKWKKKKPKTQTKAAKSLLFLDSTLICATMTYFQL